MSSGSYLNRFQQQNSGQSTPKDDASDMADEETWSKGKQLSLETNRRRREMAIRVRQEMEKEERRRKEVLEQRRHRQHTITEKFQRHRRTQSARIARRVETPTMDSEQSTLDEALHLVRATLSGQNKPPKGPRRGRGKPRGRSTGTLRRSGSVDTVLKGDPWQSEQQVVYKNNESFLEKYGGHRAGHDPFLRSMVSPDPSGPRTVFIEKLERHQNRFLLEQQKSLRDFSVALDTALQARKDEVTSDIQEEAVVDSLDDLTDPDSTFRLDSDSHNRTPSKDTHPVPNQMIVTSHEGGDTSPHSSLNADAVLNDPQLFAPLKPADTKPTSQPEQGRERTHDKTRAIPADVRAYTDNLRKPPSSSPLNTQDVFGDVRVPANDVYKPATSSANTQAFTSPAESGDVIIHSDDVRKPPTSSTNTQAFTTSPVSDDVKSPLRNPQSAIPVPVGKTAPRESRTTQPAINKAPVTTYSQPSSTAKLESTTATRVIKGPTENGKSEHIRFVVASPVESDNEMKWESGSDTDAEADEPSPPKGILKRLAGLRIVRSESSPVIGDLSAGDLRDSLDCARAKLVTRGEPRADPEEAPLPPPRKSVRFAAVLCEDLLQRGPVASPLNETATNHKVTAANSGQVHHKSRVSGRASKSAPARRPNAASKPPKMAKKPPAYPKMVPTEGLPTPDPQEPLNIPGKTPAPAPRARPEKITGSLLARIGVQDVVDNCWTEQEEDVEHNVQPSSPEPNLTKTPTEAEIDQLWAHVRTCLSKGDSPKPPVRTDQLSGPPSLRNQPDSNTPSEISVQSAPVTTPLRSQILLSNQVMDGGQLNQARYYQPRLGRGIRVVHHSANVQARRIALLRQREQSPHYHGNTNPEPPRHAVQEEWQQPSSEETYGRQEAVPSREPTKGSVTESLAEFLAAERYCTGSNGLATDVASPQPGPSPYAGPRRRVVTREQTSPPGIRSLAPHPPVAPRQQSANRTPQEMFSPNGRVHLPASQLSMDEERILKSLERLNDRLNVVALHN